MDIEKLTPGITYDICGVGFKKEPQKPVKLRKYPAQKLDSWPHVKGSYLLGNPVSPVGVVIPMPDTKLMRAAVEAGAAIAGSMVTANHGIERVVANVVANPNLRFLVLFGRESKGHLSGAALKALVENGIDGNRRIIGAGGMTPYLKNIPIELIERFREQVKIVDLLGRENPGLIQAVVKACIQEPEHATAVAGEILFDCGAFDGEPIIFKFDSEFKSSGYYEGFGEAGVCIHAQNIPQAWKMGIDAIVTHGRRARVDSDTAGVKELINLTVVIHDPLDNRIPENYQPEPWVTPELLQEYLDKYAQCLLRKDKTMIVLENGKIVFKPANTTYTYGSRLRNFSGVDQLQMVVDAIKWCKQNGVESYRLYGVLEDPAKDLSTKTEEVRPPCFALFQVFPRKQTNQTGWTLDLFCYMRAWDFHRAAPANLYGFTEILRWMCEQTDCKPGKLIVCGGSVHIYEHEL